MKVVIQRVKSASVKVEDSLVASIAKGMVILVGIGRHDKEEDACYLARKIKDLRIFEDEKGRMNLSIKDTPGEILAVSEVSLLADCRKGKRPSLDDAASSQEAKRLYQYFLESLSRENLKVKSGVFKAMMDVQLVNHGPVTIILDSKQR